MIRFIIFLFFFSYCSIGYGQKNTDTLKLSSWDVLEMRCGVAHITGDGVFSCDFRGTYYPAEIFDTTITKWFIKMNGADSVFYYRKMVDRIFIWNGRSKKDMYGYECKEIGITIPDKHNGSDTLIRREQVWMSKEIKN